MLILSYQWGTSFLIISYVRPHRCSWFMCCFIRVLHYLWRLWFILFVFVLYLFISWDHFDEIYECLLNAFSAFSINSFSMLRFLIIPKAQLGDLSWSYSIPVIPSWDTFFPASANANGIVYGGRKIEWHNLYNLISSAFLSVDGLFGLWMVI